MNNSAGDNGSYPVCGSQVSRPFRIRVLQYASLVLAVAGLILLYLFSVNRDVPVVKIGNITPTMNFACVRVVGEVTSDAHVFKSGGIIFNMKDGSGDIIVQGGRVEAASLEALGNLPRRGDQVDVAGSLSVNAGQDVKLRMLSADQLLLRRKNAAIGHSVPRVSLSDITVAHKGRQVAAVGRLKSIDVPGLGSRTPYVLTLEEDNGAELAVIFWEDVLQGLDNKLPIPGKFIRARGKVEVYQDRVQLKVGAADDLCVVESMK